MDGHPGIPSDAEAVEGSETVLEVATKGLGWAVEDKSSLFGQTYSGHSTKQEAISEARRQRNVTDGPTKIIIRREDDSVQDVIGGK